MPHHSRKVVTDEKNVTGQFTSIFASLGWIDYVSFPNPLMLFLHLGILPSDSSKLRLFENRNSPVGSCSMGLRISTQLSSCPETARFWRIPMSRYIFDMRTCVHVMYRKGKVFSENHLPDIYQQSRWIERGGLSLSQMENWKWGLHKTVPLSFIIQKPQWI